MKEGRDFSLDKSRPHFADAIDAQIDCDDASDDLIKEELHSSIHSSSPGLDYQAVLLVDSAGLRAGRRHDERYLVCSVAGFDVGSNARMRGVTKALRESPSYRAGNDEF
ncbi:MULTISPECIES: hypothetical protein [Bradyrhizobium]|uniref:hypothetical protein n=1 Tax=Bradyrhizobium TaxID=374 RepID=UPI0010089A07|nr:MULTISPECIES: hypothetical protein [Bradyrhizobium]